LILQLPRLSADGAPETTTAKTFLERGGVHHANKEYDKAIAEYTEAIKHDPKLVDAYSARARAHQARGNGDRAIDDANAAIALDSKCAAAYYTKGLALHYNKKRFSMAIENLSKAIELNPTW